MKWFSLSKILVILFLWSGESSNNSILIFFGNFFDRSSSFYYGYLSGWGVSRGAGGERGRVREGGTGRGHVPLLSASETTSLFETPFPFIRCKLLWLLLGVDIHGIGVSGGSIPGGGRGCGMRLGFWMSAAWQLKLQSIVSLGIGQFSRTIPWV